MLACVGEHEADPTVRNVQVIGVMSGRAARCCWAVSQWVRLFDHGRGERKSSRKGGRKEGVGKKEREGREKRERKRRAEEGYDRRVSTRFLYVFCKIVFPAWVRESRGDKYINKSLMRNDLQIYLAWRESGGGLVLDRDWVTTNHQKIFVEDDEYRQTEYWHMAPPPPLPLSPHTHTHEHERTNTNYAAQHLISESDNDATGG